MKNRNLAFIMGSFIFIIKFYLSIDVKDENTAFGFSHVQDLFQNGCS